MDRSYWTTCIRGGLRLGWIRVETGRAERISEPTQPSGHPYIRLIWTGQLRWRIDEISNIVGSKIFKDERIRWNLRLLRKNIAVMNDSVRILVMVYAGNGAGKLRFFVPKNKYEEKESQKLKENVLQ